MGAAERLPGIYTYADLKSMCKPEGNPTLATVERWLIRQRIPYHYDGNGGVWTTPEAINSALGIGGKLEAYRPEDLA
ncbi:hypothetical protein CSC70_04020 [Pseudoxanthomonas kalamensis DSM 18571]|uniref:hypothetical protein n=1 Tax=Pseudoxanthomonas kalamensis TaxID=289483 RepID=UPI001390B92A|nr:hypothetical protein [Pseudoxanthomonas kalamensis]KAF1711102.1 hypothetical protein CSC70_04020 [Pseudoxanthomonas kalamensis DSM 18571]